MEDETRRDEGMQQEATKEKHELTFDEMLDSNPAYRSEFDRRNTKAVNTARSKWEKEQAANQDEAKKLADMSDAQRAQYQFDKEKKTFAAEKAAFEREKLVAATATELKKRGLPDFAAAHLTGADAETTSANIDRFAGEWQTALQASVTDRMRGGKVPNDPKAKPAITRESVRKMSPAEINANWKEISKMLSEK